MSAGWKSFGITVAANVATAIVALPIAAWLVMKLTGKTVL